MPDLFSSISCSCCFPICGQFNKAIFTITCMLICKISDKNDVKGNRPQLRMIRLMKFREPFCFDPRSGSHLLTGRAVARVNLDTHLDLENQGRQKYAVNGVRKAATISVELMRSIFALVTSEVSRGHQRSDLVKSHIFPEMRHYLRNYCR